MKTFDPTFVRILLFSVFLVSLYDLSAQIVMTPATPIPPKVLRNAIIKAPAEIVWQQLIKLDNMAEYTSGYIIEVQKIGNGEGARRILKFSNSDQRTESVTFQNNRLRQINFAVANSNLPQSYMYAFYADSLSETKCRVTLRAFYNVENYKNKFEMNRFIGKEFDLILKGLKQYYEK